LLLRNFGTNHALLKGFLSAGVALLLLLTAAALAQTAGQSSAPPQATAPAQQNASTPPATPAPTQKESTASTSGSFDEVHIAPMKPEEHSTPAVGRPSSTAANTGVGAVPSDSALRSSMKSMRVDVNLVLVPVTITDPMNRLVTGLERDNFVVMDNGEKQAIKHFSSEDAPVSLGVIFDMSGSMSEKMERAKEAVVEFFKTANPDDEFFMVAFNDKPEMISDFTNSIEQVQSQLVYALPKGRTALMDAVYVGLAKMRQARNQKKALLIISDGGDNHSRYTENEIKSLVKEADVQIYAIGIFSANASSQEEVAGPTTLAAITDVTGGRTFTIDNPNELADVATKIGIELRNQYVLGYRPTKPAHDGKWRKIKVKLMPPKGLPPLTVYSKTGYYAPTD
jgi:Ca-activated chloride channel family protein